MGMIMMRRRSKAVTELMMTIKVTMDKDDDDTNNHYDNTIKIKQSIYRRFI